MGAFAFGFDEPALEPPPALVKALDALRLRDAIGTAASLAELADLQTEVIDLQVVGELVAWPDRGAFSTMTMSALISRRRDVLARAALARAADPHDGITGRR